MAELQAAIWDVLDGNLHMLDPVLKADHSDLLHSAGGLPPLVLRRPALIRAISGLRSGSVSTVKVQMWASFVRRGYVCSKSKAGIQPISIAYDGADEDMITEIVCRLDEIGDIIDGAIDLNELDGMLKSLSA